MYEVANTDSAISLGRDGELRGLEPSTIPRHKAHHTRRQAMKLTEIKSIDGIKFVSVRELKEQLSKRYSSSYELARGCDRDRLRQIAKEFGGDTRKLKKDELVELVWMTIKEQDKKTESPSDFLFDRNAPVNASDIDRLMRQDILPQSICDAILSSLVVYTDFQGNIHKYENSTIVKTYIPKINRILDYYGEEGKAVSRCINYAVKAIRMEVKIQSNHNVAELHKSLKPISESAILHFIDTVVNQCESGMIGNWLSAGLALGLLTGRRQAEIFGDAGFVKIDDTHIEFSGQMKVRGTRDDIPYSIPVINADQVLLLLEYLKNAGKRGKTTAYVNKTISTGYSRAPHLIKPLGLSFFKDSRVAYGLYHCSHNKPVNFSNRAYLGLLMGHGEDDMDTSRSYEKFTLVD